MISIEPRSATAADVEAITALVRAAYAKYVPRIGRELRLMGLDYGKIIEDDDVWVIEGNQGIAGLIVLAPNTDHMFIKNVAVDPESQGQGFGRKLLVFAEAQASKLGLSEMRLRTGGVMTENVALYGRYGYIETEREQIDDRVRIYMSKQLES